MQWVYCYFLIKFAKVVYGFGAAVATYTNEYINKLAMREAARAR
jgi:hypothetical protein